MHWAGEALGWRLARNQSRGPSPAKGCGWARRPRRGGGGGRRRRGRGGRAAGEGEVGSGAGGGGGGGTAHAAPGAAVGGRRQLVACGVPAEHWGEAAAVEEELLGASCWLPARAGSEEPGRAWRFGGAAPDQSSRAQEGLKVHLSLPPPPPPPPAACRQCTTPLTPPRALLLPPRPLPPPVLPVLCKAVNFSPSPARLLLLGCGRPAAGASAGRKKPGGRGETVEGRRPPFAPAAWLGREGEGGGGEAEGAADGQGHSLRRAPRADAGCPPAAPPLPAGGPGLGVARLDCLCVRAAGGHLKFSGRERRGAAGAPPRWGCDSLPFPPPLQTEERDRCLPSCQSYK